MHRTDRFQVFGACYTLLGGAISAVACLHDFALSGYFSAGGWLVKLGGFLGVGGLLLLLHHALIHRLLKIGRPGRWLEFILGILAVAAGAVTSLLLLIGIVLYGTDEIVPPHAYLWFAFPVGLGAYGMALIAVAVLLPRSAATRA